MKIKLKLGVSEESRSMTITPDELGYTEEDWDSFDEEQKHNLIVSFVDNLPESPYWVLEQFTTL